MSGIIDRPLPLFVKMIIPVPLSMKPTTKQLYSLLLSPQCQNVCPSSVCCSPIPSPHDSCSDGFPVRAKVQLTQPSFTLIWGVNICLQVSALSPVLFNSPWFKSAVTNLA